jgi:flotillin
VDKITIVSTGGEAGAGVNKITADMAQMVAQVPALLEALTGKKMSDLMARVRPLGPGEPPAQIEAPPAEAGRKK